MEGGSHLLVGLTAAVVLDSFTHITGEPLSAASPVAHELLLKKGIFYAMVGLGALLPDIDNAHSTLGHKLGWVSKTIQHVAGHRTLFHSLLGLALGSLIALGLDQLAIYLLAQHGYILSSGIIGGTHFVLIAVLFGCIMHIAADALTEGGVPLFWPRHKRYGFPPNPHWRFRTGSWPEFVIVYGFMIVVAVCLWQSILVL